MVTLHGRLATPVTAVHFLVIPAATSFRFLDLTICYFNFDILNIHVLPQICSAPSQMPPHSSEAGAATARGNLVQNTYLGVHYIT